MFEEYLKDTKYFVELARSSISSGDHESARRSYRVAAMIGMASLETFVNFIGSTFEQASSEGLAEYELALLLDRRFALQGGSFEVTDQIAYSRLEDKLKFLITKFSIRLDLANNKEWGDFVELKKLRDSLVHSRNDQDDTPIRQYERVCPRGLVACVGLMNRLSRGIFKKPLRKKLLDLAEIG